MKQLVANRIKSARRLAGLSMRELALRMEGIVSHNAIQKYEKAEMLPDSKVMLALARALGVKPDYFFMPYSVEIGSIEFRKKSKLPQKKILAIREKVMDSINRYLELEQLLQISTLFQNPIQNLNILTGDDVENAVNQILDAWKLGINAMPNVIELLEDKGIKIIELQEVDGFDGLSGFATGGIPFIVINDHFSLERKRFTVLHELAHILLKFDPVLEAKGIEKLCHRFAGAMLMPRETFIHELGSSRRNISISELVAIKEVYGISIQAIMARARDLSIISQQIYIQFRIWVNADPYHQKEIGLGQFAGKESSSRFRQLLYRAVAEDIISIGKGANLSNEKIADFREHFIEI